MRAGLIPSKALQERKIIHERLSMSDQKKKCELRCLFNIFNTTIIYNKNNRNLFTLILFFNEVIIL